MVGSVAELGFWMGPLADPAALPDSDHWTNSRDLLHTSPAVRDLASSAILRALVEPVLGPGAFPVCARFFNKSADANWLVPWHQDLTIRVRERRETDGYGPWSCKNGIDHVQPPVAVLENMLAVRIHLDRANARNGGLRVLPGTHRMGRLSAAQIDELAASIQPVACDVDAGGVLLMRPLLLHASSRAEVPLARRVIHIEYANCALAPGLEWFQAPKHE